MTAIGMGYNAGARRGAAGTLVEADVKAKFLGKLLNYIPGDVVAGYVAVIALVDSGNDDWAAEWQVAWSFLALSIFLVVVSFVAKFRKENAKAWPNVRAYPWFRLLVAPVAFAAWVYSLPSSPVQDWAEVDDYSKTLVLIASAIVLAGLGMVFEPDEV